MYTQQRSSDSAHDAPHVSPGIRDDDDLGRTSFEHASVGGCVNEGAFEIAQGAVGERKLVGGEG